MPVKVSPNGSYRFNRTFSRGTGREPLRVTRASGVKGDWEQKKVQREFHYREGLLSKLYEAGDLSTLERFQNGEITIQEIIAFDKLGKLGTIGRDIVATRPLWKTWEEMIPSMRTGKNKPLSPQSIASYTGSMKRLKALNLPGLGEDAQILNLTRVDWSQAHDAWTDSAAAWNHMGRALSRFLTLVLDDKQHPIRREVMKRFPKMDEHPRQSSLTRMQFYRILDMLPFRWRSYFVVLAVTGLRIGELVALKPEDLDHDAHMIRVRDAKTKAGVRPVFVAEAFWPYVRAAIPVPVTHWHLRELWNSAVDRAQLKDIRIHDLRHFAAQQLSDAKVPEASIQAVLGHADADMTRMYSMQTARKETAEVMAEIFPVLKLDEDQTRKLLVREVP